MFQNLTDSLIIAPCDRSLSLDHLQHKTIISKAILMKLVNTFLIFLMALLFCGATAAQQVDNPHQQSLAAVRAGNLAKLR
ncbi:MAG: hypothetical protein ACO23B_05915, partial [Burkholderiaceae bacterium]